MADLFLWADDTEFVIAESADAAAAIAIGMGLISDPDPELWEKFPPERPFTLDPCDGTPTITKPAAEFVAERGRGWLATSEY